MCRSCRKFQRPSATTCVQCGADKPEKRPVYNSTRKSGKRVSMNSRSAATRKRERESGVGTTDMRRLRSMNEREKRLARGRALRNSPLALDIEQAVARRLSERKEREEAEGEV